MVKPQGRDENAVNTLILVFRGCFRVFDFCPAIKKQGVFGCSRVRLRTIRLVRVCCIISLENGLFWELSCTESRKFLGCSWVVYVIFLNIVDFEITSLISLEGKTTG